MKNEIIQYNIPKIPIRISASEAYETYEAGYMLSTAHYHDEIEILPIKKGCIELVSDGKSCFAKEGDIIFVASRTVHETIAAQEQTGYNLIQFKVNDYLNDFGKNMMRFINLNETPVYVFRHGNKETEELARALESLFYEYKTKNNGYEIYIKGSIYNVLGILIRRGLVKDNSDFSNSKDSERLIPLILYIDKNYAEEITLSSLASIVNLNSQYLCRLFKSVTKSTIWEYINFVRISKAEKLLSTSDGTISEIAMNTGFASVSYFNRVFKKYKKYSPSEFRKIKFTLA